MDPLSFKWLKRVQALLLWRGLSDVPQPQYSPSLVYELEESEEDEHDEDDDRPENEIKSSFSQLSRVRMRQYRSSQLN